MGTESGRRNLALATEAGNEDWLRKAHNILGIAYADNGGVADALLHYAAALEMARRIGDLRGELGAWQNIGTAMNYAGLFHEAIRCFVHAIERSEGHQLFRRRERRASVERLERQEPGEVVEPEQARLRGHEDGGVRRARVHDAR